jgi:hypothetical protein
MADEDHGGNSAVSVLALISHHCGFVAAGELVCALFLHHIHGVSRKRGVFLKIF